MILIGIGIILLVLAVVFFGICFIKGLRNITVNTITVNVEGIPSAHIPSVFSDDHERPESVTKVTPGAEPVVVPSFKDMDNIKVESNIKVKEKKAKGSLRGVTDALKKTIKEKANI